MTIPLAWVDAFSDAPFGGNPAGVCLLDEPLDEARMQSIAFELGIAETAFLVPGDVPDHLRPALVLAGHRDRPLRPRHPGLRPRAPPVGDGRRHDTAHLPHQERPPARQLRRRPRGPRLPGRPHRRGAAARLALQAQWPGSVVHSGHTSFFTFVALSSAEAVRAYEPDLAAIAATGAKALLLTAAAAPASGADYVLRVFGPNVGIPEDSATGSAQCSAGPYWAAELGRERPGRAPAVPPWGHPLRAPGG